MITQTTAIFLAIVLAVQPALADDQVMLVCRFEHGTLEIGINYSQETVNDSPAMISDKEIVWSPGENKDNLAIINRYTGVIRMGNNRKEYTGLCKKASQPGK